MRLAAFITAFSEWVRALAPALAVLLVGVAVFIIVAQIGIDRTWAAALFGSVCVGVGLPWSALRAFGHVHKRRDRASDGEGEPL
jgi:predicted RND superfamily exporter protein